MIERRLRAQVGLLVATDAVATAAAAVGAWWLRFHVEIQPVTKGVPPLDDYLRLLPVVVLLYPLVFAFQGLYRPRRIRSRIDEMLRVLSAVLLATVVLAAALTFYRDATYSRVALAIFFALEVGFVTAARWMLLAVLARIRRTSGRLQRVLVVGAGELGRQVATRLEAHQEYGFRVVGFVDDDPGKQRRSLQGFEVLGTTHELDDVITTHGVDQVVVALPLAAHHRTAEVIQRAGRHLVDVRVVPDLLQYYVMRTGVEDLDGLPMINLTHMPLQGFNQVLKRGFDLTVASAMLLVAAPVLPVIAWLIRREDGGPVLFAQERTGLDGRSFRLYKFRSMRIEAENDRTWTRTNDDRVTRIGAFLRRTNLDELPQLINVLRGDMSLVGPRPEQPEFVERFRSRYPEYHARHRVRTGLTGWAQVNGLRGDTSIRQRVVHDLYYIENWTFGLDLKILWLTMRQVLRPARA
jgi:exopolysaccharide biosynthesis polyprenyl glycosylphosphotransferase